MVCAHLERLLRSGVKPEEGQGLRLNRFVEMRLVSEGGIEQEMEIK